MDYIISGFVALLTLILFLASWIIMLKKKIIEQANVVLTLKTNVDKQMNVISEQEKTIAKKHRAEKTTWDYGRLYEISVGRHFCKDYEINFNGLLKGALDEGIDVIATKFNNDGEAIEVLLIQCKYLKGEDFKFNQAKAKEFDTNCHNYVNKYMESVKNKIDIYGVLAIPSKDSLDPKGGAKIYFSEHSPRLRYEIIEMDKDLIFNKNKSS
jgi:hypothetical protein